MSPWFKDNQLPSHRTVEFAVRADTLALVGRAAFVFGPNSRVAVVSHVSGQG